ncbi:MAG: M20/M25/M40 family metallo-hydrolase, partial [Oscillospiraceae bacterium]|nr:M20/M25/M40 family metallo-hydrolase [Oscillospiraceae bacterium]
MSELFQDSALLQEIDRFVEEQKDSIVRDIGRLVAIPSVQSEPEPGAPYGPGPRQALDCALGIAAELGLKTASCCENRMGYAQVGEERGEGYLATISHVDVVPAGEGWPEDPFTLREQEGYLIGRGVTDDKGPSILCLYALKYLQDSGRRLRYPIRALLGSSEEIGMDDIGY